MDANTRKCLVRWHEYSNSVTFAVQTLRCDEELLDVTLACEGQTIRAHKLVLAASSQYFRQILKDFPCEHPTIVVDGIKWKDLVCLLQFMYHGQVLIEEEEIPSLLMAASSLAVIGLNYVTAALCQPPKVDTKGKDVETKNPEKALVEDEEKTVLASEAKRRVKEETEKMDEKTARKNNGSTSSPCFKDVSPATITQKDTPSPLLTNETSLSSPVNNCSISSPQPNISSIGLSNLSEKTSSATQIIHLPRRKLIDKEEKEQNYPPSKKMKPMGENDPPKDPTGRIVWRNSSEDGVRPNSLENGDSNVYLGRNSSGNPDKFEKGDFKYRNFGKEQNWENRKDNSYASSRYDRNTSIGSLAVNGDSQASSKIPNYADLLDNELSQDAPSPENGDSDMGPAPLPMNHPAVLAASSSVAAAAAAFAAVANGGSMNPAAVNYAALLAANSRGMLTPSGMPNSPSPATSGASHNIWVPPMSSTSPSPSPPAHGLPQGFIHPPGMSQQDLQATLEHYQRKLAFHEPRPCPTCQRMYRDAATLRTHITIMHSEGKEPFSCTCGALFRTKYDMYQHKKNGHR